MSAPEEPTDAVPVSRIMRLAADPLGIYMTMLIAAFLLAFEPLADGLGPKKVLLFLVLFFAVLVPSRMLAQAISTGITQRRTLTSAEVHTMLGNYLPLVLPLTVPLLALMSAALGSPWKRGSVAVAIGFWWCIVLIVILGVEFGRQLHASRRRRLLATGLTLLLCAALVGLRVLMLSLV